MCTIKVNKIRRNDGACDRKDRVFICFVSGFDVEVLVGILIRFFARGRTRETRTACEYVLISRIEIRGFTPR